jgi:hypothetical protein
MLYFILHFFLYIILNSKYNFIPFSFHKRPYLKFFKKKVMCMFFLICRSRRTSGWSCLATCFKGSSHLQMQIGCDHVWWSSPLPIQPRCDVLMNFFRNKRLAYRMLHLLRGGPCDDVEINALYTGFTPMVLSRI